MEKIAIDGRSIKMLIGFSTISLLVACGGGSQDTKATGAQLLANGEACNAAWVSTTVYNAGNTVSYAGVNYTAGFYTKGDNPSTNHGASKSDGKPWIIGFTCGGTTTTTTTKATTTTTAAGTTTTKAATTTTTKTTTTTTSGSGLNPGLSPGGNFNLGGWALQLPTGSSGNIDTKTGAELEAGFTNQYYFYTDSGDGSMVMADPATGWTTSGSLHPRVEMRENAIWATSGTNTLDVTVKVTKVPDHTAIGQIFQGTGPSKPLCELQYFANGTVKLLLESTNEGGSSTSPTVGSVSLGTKFTYQLGLSGSTITVKVNSTVSTFALPSSFVGESFYFKAGDYDQSAVSGTPKTTTATVVQFYALNITHK